MKRRRAEQGLPRSQRLRRRADFQAVYEEGRRVVCPYFVGFVLEKSEGPLRVGVVASRRVGGAVARNRAKRLLREVFRKHKPRRDVSADVVLVARGAIARASMAAVEAAYARYLERFLEKIR